MSLRFAVTLALVAALVVTPTAQTFFGTVASPVVGHPVISMTSGAVSPTVAELKARLGTGGAQATQFQQFIGIYCKTAANGGVLDTFVANYNWVYGLWIYGYILATYPVAGAGTTFDYYDCTSQSAIETPFLQMYDIGIAAGLCGFGCPNWDAICKAYDWGYGSLSASRRAAGEAWMLAAVDDDLSAGPLHHRRSTGALQYLFTGNCINDATRLALRPTNWLNATGVRNAETTVAGLAGGEASGIGYFLTELDWHGMGILAYTDGARTSLNTTADVTPGANTVIEYYPQWLTYLLYPYTPAPSPGFPGFMWAKTSESVDQLTDPTNYPYAETFIPPFLKNVARIYQSSNATMASLAQWLVQTLFYTSGDIVQSTGSITATNRHALWGNYLGYNTATAQSPAALSLPFAKWLDPFGAVFIRDGWTLAASGGGNSVVKFEAAPFQWTNNGYGQVTPGSFTVHRNGPIVVDPGAGAHSVLQEMTWGASMMAFPKPLETRAGRFSWDKGGARPPYNFSTPTQTTQWAVGSQWDIGGLKTSGCTGGTSGGPCARIDLSDDTATHTYSYVYSDLSRAYNGTQNIDSENSAKISNYERQVARFIPPTPGTDPGFTVIYDRTTTTGTDVEPRWMLYPAATTSPTVNTMTITGSSVACDPTMSTCTVRNGVNTPYWTGTCGTMYGTISYSNINALSAKGYWRPLIPATCKIIQRGGANAMGQIGQTDSHEWEDPYGYQGGNYFTEGAGAVLSHGSAFQLPWEGLYRFELLYQTTQQTSPFLNVIEDVETSAVAPTTLATLSGTNTTGVRIDATAGKRCAIFKSTTGTLSTGDFVLATTGTYDCLLADLVASSPVTFTKGSNITSVTLISDGDTDLTYTTTASRTLWLRIVVGGAGSGANNTISW